MRRLQQGDITWPLLPSTSKGSEHQAGGTYFVNPLLQVTFL